MFLRSVYKNFKRHHFFPELKTFYQSFGKVITFPYSEFSKLSHKFNSFKDSFRKSLSIHKQYSPVIKNVIRNNLRKFGRFECTIIFSKKNIDTDCNSRFFFAQRYTHINKICYSILILPPGTNMPCRPYPNTCFSVWNP